VGMAGACGEPRPPAGTVPLRLLVHRVGGSAVRPRVPMGIDSVREVVYSRNVSSHEIEFWQAILPDGGYRGADQGFAD
jgi:hypothetical protein